jgi:hypothetical protein
MEERGSQRKLGGSIGGNGSVAQADGIIEYTKRAMFEMRPSGIEDKFHKIFVIQTTRCYFTAQG